MQAAMQMACCAQQYTRHTAPLTGSSQHQVTCVVFGHVCANKLYGNSVVGHMSAVAGRSLLIMCACASQMQHASTSILGANELAAQHTQAPYLHRAASNS